MTNEEASYKTKCELAETLKKLMLQKPFSKITISEIIRECNVNRKTFYYHFEDIYALLKWIFEQEAIEIFKKYDFWNNYKEAIAFVFDYVETNSYIINCAYDSLGRDALKSFFCQDIINITRKIIIETENALGISIADDFRTYLSNLYTEGIAGMIIQLFQNPTAFERQKIIEYTGIIINSSIPSVLKAYASTQSTL